MSDREVRKPIAISWHSLFDVASTVAMLGIAVMIAFQGHSRLAEPTRQPTEAGTQVPSEPVPFGTSPVLGRRGAPVALMMYSDFECPYCGTAATKVLPVLRREYVEKGTVMLVFKHLPLDIHPGASRAAAAAVCAHEQGKFWAAHDAFFANTGRLTEPDLRLRVSGIGLDLGEYDICRGDRRNSQQVDSDKAEAAALGITATPTFLFGKVEGNRLRVTHTLVGIKRLPTFRRLLDQLLNDEPH